MTFHSFPSKYDTALLLELLMPWKRRQICSQTDSSFFFPSTRHSALLSKCFPGLACPQAQYIPWEENLEPSSLTPPAPLRPAPHPAGGSPQAVTPWSWITAANNSGGEVATAGFQGCSFEQATFRQKGPCRTTRPPSPHSWATWEQPEKEPGPNRRSGLHCLYYHLEKLVNRWFGLQKICSQGY